MKPLDKYVIFSLAVVLIYTIVQLWIFYQTGNEATTLTTCVYGTFGGEVLTCAVIKIFKLRRKDDG